MPDSYLVWAVLSTIFGCLPFGVVSIVYATKVERLYFNGLYDESLRASRKAKNWCIAAAVSAAVVLLVYIVFYFAILAAVIYASYKG